MIRCFCTFLVAVVVVGIALTPGVRAQQRARTDTLLQFETRKIPGGRIDVNHKVWRARYRMTSRGATASPDAVLREQAAAFGWSDDLNELRLIEDRREPHSRHVTYQQVFRGVPVDGRLVRVNMDQSDRATMVLSGYVPIATDGAFETAPSISETQARRLGEERFMGQGGRMSTPELVVYPSKRAALAWRVIAWPEDEPAEYVIILDAHTGQIISERDQALSHRPIGGGSEKTRKRAGTTGNWTVTDVNGRPVTAGPANLAGDDSSVGKLGAGSFTDGSGYVYAPDPITKAGVPYGAPYEDGNDVSNAELDAQRSLVILPEIATDGLGQYILEGPYVKIIDRNQAGSITYAPPHLPGPNDFMFRRSDLDFEAVNAYYHLDASQRYVQSFGITDRQSAPIGVNPHGLTSDDSFYFPNQNILVFGSGGVDDAEDASVLWHEYAHALLQAAAPGLLSTTEGVALHEGWSDYWAASYARDLWERGLVSRSDWDRLFRWDTGDGQFWSGRVLNHMGHYPEDTCSDNVSPAGCSPHNDGRLWGTVLMEIYSDIGKAATDELNLQSHAYILAPATFTDFAEALIQADIDYFDGTHLNVLLNRLGARGLVDVNGFWPTLSHDPIHWREDLGGTATITAEAIGISSPVKSVMLRYEDIGGTDVDVQLQPISGDVYEGSLPLPATPGSIFYYLEVTDTADRVTMLPANAPANRFELNVGPDTTSPLLLHEPLPDIPFATWPPTIEATVWDNLGLAHVTVGYRIQDLFGTELVQGSFELSGVNDSFSGTIPVEPGVLPSHVNVFYWIEAVDASVAANLARAPSDGFYEFTAVSDGVIRNITFETASSAVSLEGIWARGEPQFGLRAAHSGSQVVGTNLAGAYLSSPGLSTMSLARVNLSGVPDALLSFWHWYDIESDGSADPESSGAQVWDGGNLKVSVDGGQTWSILNPEGGYNGIVAQSQSNPLSGEAAFGGYSYGWRQVIAPLPAVADVRVRFDFGTDDSNSDTARWFAGWYIDDVLITTERPEDADFPVAVSLPQRHRILSTGEAQPEVVAQLADDNGVEDVFLDYTYRAKTGEVSGTIRMELDPATLTRYRTTLSFLDLPGPSEQVDYTIRASDHSGNSSLFPGNEGKFEIEYWLVESRLVTAEATSSGIWSWDGDRWGLDGREPASDVASINLVPIDLPDNATLLELVMTHEYDLARTFGGNVKISDDGGKTWSVLEPVSGYPSELNLDSAHSMDGESGFGNDGSGAVTDRFLLDAWAGRQIRLRIDLATERAARADEHWTILSIELESSTVNDTFEIPRTLELHPAYPNPFGVSTRIGYTVSEPGPVELAMFDAIGRRVRVIATGFHDAGTYETSVSASDLTAGVYFVRLIAAGAQAVQTVVVIR